MEVDYDLAVEGVEVDPAVEGNLAADGWMDGQDGSVRTD